MNITILDTNENFITYINPDKCEVEETVKSEGLRTLKLTYAFNDFNREKEYFRIGNKVWVQGDINISDCLYVINTQVEQDVYEDNTFTIDLEEVLVELNYAPPIYQTEITADNGFKKNVEQWVVNYNSLKYCFGDWFNIGVVQDTISVSSSYASFTGSISRMGLLRKIEEQTGNVFVTRYEKDILNNTIHRYLDFLNPINVAKNWNYNIEYDFVGQDTLSPAYDSQGNPTTPDELWEVGRFDDGVPAGSVEEDIWTPEWVDPYIKGTADPTFVWNQDAETVPIEVKDYTPVNNIDPTNVAFRIVNTDGDPIDPYTWSSSDVGFTAETTHATITLCMVNTNVGIVVNNRSFVTLPSDTTDENRKSYVNITDSIVENLDPENTYARTNFPDDAYFEIYNTTTNEAIFRTCVNREIGYTHEEILDFNHNITHVKFEVDESETYISAAPVIQQKENDSNALGKEDMNSLINKWQNLEINKGDIIPLDIERTFVVAATWEDAIDDVLGMKEGTPTGNQAPPWSITSNYWSKPFKQNNQLNDSDPTQNKWEAFRATSYWKAPYTKKKGETFIRTDEIDNIQYDYIIGRQDTRNERGPSTLPKMGNETCKEEDPYQIYNEMCTFLQEHEDPKLDITVDVANLKDDTYNKYEVHDKVYLKLPGSQDLVTARVTETKKNMNNPLSNSIKINNYTTRNTIRVLKKKTEITSDNITFTYPQTHKAIFNLKNLDYDSQDQYDVQYPPNKLINISVHDKDNKVHRVYTKRTSAYGNVWVLMDYDPGDYTCRISFNGDEEYEESTLMININVAGIKDVVTPTETKVEGMEESTTTTYWDKYGRSPDKAKILAIGRISAGSDTGSYANFYETEFKNKCPHCGKDTLYWGIFWAGNEYSNWGTFPATGRKEGGSAEGHIFCSNCDADYSCQGNEHVSGGKKLSVTKSTALSSKAKAYELRNGKRIYSQKTVYTATKQITSSSTSGSRKCIGNVDSTVKNQALAVVGGRTGLAAAQAIASWIDNHIKYDYYTNFQRSAKKVLQMGRCNCCDGARLFNEMCDAAGCTEFLKLEYIYVDGHVYNRVTVKSTGKWYNVDTASDVAGSWGYVCRDYRNLSILRRTTYPTRPF